MTAIYSCATFDVEAGSGEQKHGDRIMVADKHGVWNEFLVFGLRGMCDDYGLDYEARAAKPDCVLASLEPMGVSIVMHKQARKVFAGYRLGDSVTIEGRSYTIGLI